MNVHIHYNNDKILNQLYRHVGILDFLGLALSNASAHVYDISQEIMNHSTMNIQSSILSLSLVLKNHTLQKAILTNPTNIFCAIFCFETKIIV